MPERLPTLCTLIDVRRDNAVECLCFADAESLLRFRDFCRLYATEAGKPFGSPGAYWLLDNGHLQDTVGVPTGTVTVLDTAVLRSMTALLWMHRTGETDTAARTVFSEGRAGTPIGFNGIAIPAMRPISRGDAIIVIRKRFPTLQEDADLKGIVVSVDADSVSYVRTKYVTSTGHIDKNALISHASRADVRFHPEAEVTSGMVRKLADICSLGDLLLRPFRYGTDVLLTTWFRRQAIFPGASEDPENAKDLRVTYRGRMRDCTGAETDQGVMLEFEGILADVLWTPQIASLKPVS